VIRSAQGGCVVCGGGFNPGDTDAFDLGGSEHALCRGPRDVVTMDSEVPADILGLHVGEQGPDVRVVTVTGDVDARSAPALASVLTTQLSVARVVVVDLDGVALLGSAGLTALFGANELARGERRVLRLVCHSPAAHRALVVTELRDQFCFAETVADAVNRNGPKG
jgi:anti-anti-sigma factor